MKKNNRRNGRASAKTAPKKFPPVKIDTTKEGNVKPDSEKSPEQLSLFSGPEWEKWWEAEYDDDYEDYTDVERRLDKQFGYNANTGEVDDEFEDDDYFYSFYTQRPQKVREPSGIKGSGTLVIHPEDESTDMLKLIYEDKDYTVMNDCNITDDELYDLIEQHDKIIMLGHGTSGGLLNPRRGGYLIDSYFASLLLTKETVSIWCHSDEFFRRHKIPGFHTGMIISEVHEARYAIGETPLNAEETLENMIFFSKIVGECIEMSPTEMKDYILKYYVGDDKVTQFNRKNILVL